jgi:hypothetical protein
MPHINESYTLAGKLFWALVFCVCAIAFSYQTYWTISQYLRYTGTARSACANALHSYKTNIELQLLFEAAPFPAVTICNLNAYKQSLVQAVPDISRSASACAVYTPTCVYSWKCTNKTYSADPDDPPPTVSLQTARAFGTDVKCTTHPSSCDAHVRRPCTTVYRSGTSAAHTTRTHCSDRHTNDTTAQVCMCYQERETGNIWPCYPSTVWSEQMCTKCSPTNSCVYPRKPLNASRTCACVCVRSRMPSCSHLHSTVPMSINQQLVHASSGG